MGGGQPTALGYWGIRGRSPTSSAPLSASLSAHAIPLALMLSLPLQKMAMGSLNTYGEEERSSLFAESVKGAWWASSTLSAPLDAVAETAAPCSSGQCRASHPVTVARWHPLRVKHLFSQPRCWLSSWSVSPKARKRLARESIRFGRQAAAYSIAQWGGSGWVLFVTAENHSQHRAVPRSHRIAERKARGEAKSAKVSNVWIFLCIFICHS